MTANLLYGHNIYGMQAGPVARISLPDASTEGRPKFGFCFYESIVSHRSILWQGTRHHRTDTNLLVNHCVGVQESAKYAHALFQNNVRLFGNTMRVDYSPQGNPEPAAPQSTALDSSSAMSVVSGQLAAAGGGTIIKRKPRNPNS